MHAPRIIRDDNTTTNRALKERESYYREHAGRGDFEREREREREIGKSILEEIREKSCLRRRRERHFVRERKDKKNSLFVKRERGTREKVF